MKNTKDSFLSDQKQVNVKVNQNLLIEEANSSLRANSRIEGAKDLQSVVTAERGLFEQTP